MKTTDNPIRDVLVKASTAGYTMADVCRVAQIDQSQVSRWLSGRTKPLYASVVRLNQVVDANVPHLSASSMALLSTCSLAATMASTT